MRVRFSDVSVRYDASEPNVLDRINMEIADHELVSLLGPSGSGKSTTLNLIAGLLFPTDGHIYFDDTDVTRWDAVKRKVGMVFQNYALYPHLSVRDNIAFPLKMAGVKKAERYEAAEQLAELVRVTDWLDKAPHQLSGGQQQRVAIARALAKQPALLLMDEPLSNLDAKLRVEMREEIRRIQQETGITTIFVTHDQSEALSISDRVIVINDGAIQQASEPDTLYRDPANLFVATFLGTPELNRFESRDYAKLVPSALQGKVKTVGVRPEDIEPTNDTNAAVLHGTVTHVSRVGRERDVEVELDGGQRVRLADPRMDVARGDAVDLSFDSDKAFYFDAEGRRVRV